MGMAPQAQTSPAAEHYRKTLHNMGVGFLCSVVPQLAFAVFFTKVVGGEPGRFIGGAWMFLAGVTIVCILIVILIETVRYIFSDESSGAPIGR